MNEQQNDTQPESRPERPRRSLLTATVAWLALVIALIAFGGGLYLEKEREKLKDRIADVRLELRDTEQALSRRDAGFATRDALALIESDTGRRLLDVERRYDELSASFERLRTQTEGAHGAWVHAEVEFVIRSAAHHLEIERDPRAALVALRAVERRLGQYADPLYGPLAARIEQDIAALERAPVPDIEGIVLTLDGIANRIDALPLDDVVLRPDRERRVREPGFAGVDWRGAWRRIRHSFKEMVTIRRAGRPEQVLLAPDEHFFVHLNAKLKVEGTRVSALRRDASAYRSGLRGARAWVESWYDTDDDTVQAVLGELRQLEAHDLEPSLPDLAETLRVLRATGDRLGSR